MNLIDQILNLDARVILEAPATAEQLEGARRTLGDQLPPLFLELLERSNGGEFSFCRFQPSPYLPETGEDLWEHVANSYPPSDLIDRREFLPLGDDYGDGLYCLNFRQSPTSVTFVPFYATSEDEFEPAAETFQQFLEQALVELEQAARVKSSTVHLDLSRSTDSPELAELGVRLRLVERALVVEAERSSPFPDERQLRLYQDETRSVFFTLEPLASARDLPYGLLNEANNLKLIDWRMVCPKGTKLCNGGGYQHLRDPKAMRLCPVWSLVWDEPLSRSSRLELQFEYQEPR